MSAEHVQNCHVDYLSFTIHGFHGCDLEDMRDYALTVIRDIFGNLPVEVSRRGWRGYDTCLKVGGGMVAFGGNNATMYFDFPGDMCSLVANWEALARFLDDDRIVLKRIDLAHDDFTGETLSMQWAREAYQQGGFKPSRGMSPKCRFLSDEGSGDGCTFYVGSRLSGKMARIYEKGKQLGDPYSPWLRFEVEWHDTHRDLSVDMLRDPAAYLAASYPCAQFISKRQSYVKTVAFKAAASLEKAIDHAKKQAGGVIKALQELGHTATEIFAELAKPEVSPRLAVSVEHMKRAKNQEKVNPAPPWYKAPTVHEIRETETRLKFDFSFWRSRWSEYQPENLGVCHAS